MSSRSWSSWWLRFLDKTNVTVTGLTALCILYTRSVGIAYFSLGALACSFAVKGVKRLIRQPRPDHLHPKLKKKTYGMPSTHSAAITFYATYISLAAKFLPIHPSLPPSPLTRTLPVALAIPWASSVIYSRIRLGHHTWPQVGVGCAFGAIFAGMWFRLWTSGLNEAGWDVEMWTNAVMERSLST
ncbi:PAP2-domain-containing protein [Schizopora paradoxa]|uniref:PAP2-domain-containing protein n=1 Tax=Schizopora paradoxa TaxID=27342 RepID=A0A0H2SFT0_9AGAM|nr:PAP2-domain-containing protein [Schizopora paradoxa]